VSSGETEIRSLMTATEVRRETPSADKRAAQIARQLEDEIIARGWPVGEVLGSETELQARFGVSRSVLREAVRLLEHHQVGRMRRGPNGGLFVAAPDAGPATRALVIYLEFVGTSVEHLLQARLLLEPLAARLAAGAVTEEGIDRLREVLAIERERWDDWDLRPADDLTVVLGRLSGNVVLQLFVEVLIRLSYRYLRPARHTRKEQQEAVKSLAHARHVEIVDAVIAGDAATAETRLAGLLEETSSWMRPDQLRHSVLTSPDPSVGTGRKLAEVVAERIHEDIAADGWRVGTVFGSESDLLDRYEVSRAVLREAVRLLEHHSVARMRRGPGGGLVVHTPDPTASIHTVALYLDHEGLSPNDLRVVREAIELGCIHAVTAGGASPDTADRLRTAVERAVERGDSGDVFHNELADLAGNPVLTLFLRIITELWARHSRTQRPPTPAVGDEVRRVHEKILEAVLSGDDGLAQHRMRRHLQALTAWWH
jgi:DNA-binding FadR family transcriptional regulator